MEFNRSDENVGSRVFKGAMFLAGARLILRLFSLINLVVLGRLLAPEDYGVAALAMVIISMIQVLSDMRINGALISLPTIDRTHLDTGFTINFIRGILIAAILFLFAGPIADLANEPKLEDVLRVLSIVLVFDGARNPAFMMYQRNIDFSKEFRRRVLATLCGAIAAITFAVITESYWAIVAGTLAERFVEMLLSYWRIPHKVRFGLKTWRIFVSFGGWLSLAAIIGHFTFIAPRLLMGRYLGAADLGMYTIGRDIAELATTELGVPLGQAVMPGLGAIAHDQDRLRGAYNVAQSTMLGIAMPIGVGVALMAEELIAVLVGTKWLPASEVIVLLGPVTAFAMVSAVVDGLAMAKLATRQMFNRAVFLAIVGLPLYYYAVTNHGFTGILYAVVFRLLLQAAVEIHFAKTLIGGSLFAPFVASWRTMVAVGAMAAAVGSIPAPFVPGQSEFIVFSQMLPRVALGAGIYVLVHLVLWRLAGKPDGFETRMRAVGGAAREKWRNRRASSQAN